MAPLPSWCPPYSSLKIDPETQQEVYCICKQPDDGRLMVGCDGCDDWFHFSCMRIPEAYQDLVYSFYCPYCQAGIAGKKDETEGKDDTVALPKTLWKRKCRLKNCYKPCKEGSKYCSEEHGLEYVQDAVGRLRYDKAGPTSRKRQKFDELSSKLKKMLICSDGDIQKFKVLGTPEFIFEDVPVPPSKLSEPEIYQEIIANDAGLSELQNNMEICISVTFPQLDQDTDNFQRYTDWINEINKRLRSEDDNDTQEVKNPSGAVSLAKTKISKKRKGKKNGGVSVRSKTKRNICGYSTDISVVPCSVDEFLEGYKKLGDSGETQLYGICIKTKCSRHSEWVSIRSEQLEQRQMSLESYKERLKLLIKTRKQQLHIQYYEKLVELQRKEEQKAVG